MCSIGLVHIMWFTNTFNELVIPVSVSINHIKIPGKFLINNIKFLLLATSPDRKLTIRGLVGASPLPHLPASAYLQLHQRRGVPEWPGRQAEAGRPGPLHVYRTIGEDRR